MEWQLMTAEQKDITGLVRKFLENELAPLVQECDGVPDSQWKYLKNGRDRTLGNGYPGRVRWSGI